jgi:hypothetical protein
MPPDAGAGLPAETADDVEDCAHADASVATATTMKASRR